VNSVGGATIGGDVLENSSSLSLTAEHRALNALIPRVAAVTLLVLFVGGPATDKDLNGTFNKPIYAGILLLATAVTVLFVRRNRPTIFDVAIALLSGVGLVWGIWEIERPLLLNFGYWEGFGYRVALASVVLLLGLAAILPLRRVPTRIRLALSILVLAVCAFDIVSGIRTLDYMVYVNNNLNEVNDILGPMVGKIPESTFIPQYTALYGWLFAPLKGVLSPLAIVGAIAIFLTVLGFVTVGLAVSLVKRVLPGRGWILALALVVPITYVTSHATGDISSIASLFQALPIRLFSGFLIVAVGLQDLVLLYRGTLRSRRLLAVGALCGLIAWNSQDFGVAATGVYGLMVLALPEHSVRWRALGVWLAGLAIGVALYPLFLLAIGHPLNLAFVGAFAKLFGAGLGSASIQVPGPVLVVVPIIVSATAAGWALITARRHGGTSDGVHLDRAAIALTFVGTWSSAGLLYYVNRGYAAGQLQTMLLPAGVCVAILVAIALHAKVLGEPHPMRFDPKTLLTTLSRRITLIPMGLFVCLCLMSALLTPDPILAVSELRNPPAGGGFTNNDLPQVLAAVDLARSYTAGKPGSLTYLGESFNYVSLAVHVPSNAILFPYSISHLHGQSIVQIECEYIRDHHSRWMVLSADALNAFTGRACGMYHAVNLKGLIYGQLQELN
jgi:hypothetical protein